MAAYLMCVTVSGGVPIFNRKFGDIKSLPYPMLGSLNGVAMFAQSHDVTLITTITKNCKLLWRDYHNSVRLIIAVPFDTLSDVHVHRMLDNIFQAMVLIVGLDDLVAQRNLERTKRDLRAAYGLIDRFLETVAPTENLSTFGDLVGAADCVVFPEANSVQEHLDKFVEAVDSTYGCVLLRGQILTATKNWWGLHPDEIVLIMNYLLSEIPAVLKDTPVFLPVKSPTVPFRLVTCELVQDVTLCVLCGPNPSLVELQPMLQKYWKNTLSLMTSAKSIMPRKFPPIQIDKTILGFLVVNVDKRRVFGSMSPHGEEGDSKQMSQSRKHDILRGFIRNVVGPIFPDIYVPNPYSVDPNTGDNMAFRVPHAQLKHPVSETYISSEYHKCFALQHLQYQFFGIFVAAVPNHSMRNIAHRTLQLILKDKTFNIVRAA